MTGRISFIGAGPGAADLITLRGARRIAEADIVVFSPAVVDADCVREHARADAELVDFSRVPHERVLETYRRAAVKGLSVVRLHTGDGALWGAVQEQYDAAQKIGLEVEIVPGVSGLAAAAAAAGRELSPAAASAPVVLTRPEGDAGALPDGEKLRELAQHGGTMAIALSGARTDQLVEELRAGGYAEDTPVVVAYKTSWPDELLIQTTLAELAGTVKDHRLWRTTLFLVGQVLRPGGTRQRLFTKPEAAPRPSTGGGYRRSDFAARRAERLAAAQPADEVVEAEVPVTASTWRDRLEATRSARAGARYRPGASKRSAAAATRTGQVTLALHDEQDCPPAERPAPEASAPAPVAAPDAGTAPTAPATPVAANGAAVNGATVAVPNGSALAVSTNGSAPATPSPSDSASEPSPSAPREAAPAVSAAVKAPAAKMSAGKSKAKSTATRRTKRTPRNS
ncbi:precorrin-4/cobalt-precorrin-4 C11-methyltransferase [Crossiella equi]|uniref:Precorrin-4/cobalt-precorrin-4 C11-methyltransferase n=1 Tax=Crossiella equi TaxID=130796 RepID=A0ABS5AKP3_9PSEU|nr:cobalt-precorrin-4/precorrin-4 C(11)-methyltransferase [Crossiella equi]MBP2477139.1 precorrin-4/cobalt-precorrin-4 C11-methyltransferase [Crossiella equi]